MDDYQSLKQRYDAAIDAFDMIVTRNAQRAACSGNPPSEEEHKLETDAQAELEAARIALAAAIVPSAI